MRKLILAAGVMLAVALPAVALAQVPSGQHAKRYVREYHAARAKFGASAVGCNLLERRGSCHVRAKDADVVKSLGVLDRMLAPPPPPVTLNPPAPVAVAAVPGVTSARPSDVTVPAYTTSVQSPSYGASSGGPPACTWQPESGGNWNAVNPSSGAYGRYQILPSTAAAHGCNLSTHQGQTDCASAIWANGSGRSQWVNC